MLRKVGRSLLLLALWLAVPAGLLIGVTFLQYQFPPVTLASTQGVSDHSWDSGYAYAQGTWVMENEQIGSPQNEAVIVCRREIGTCFESTAEIFRGGGSMRLLANRVDTHTIDRWDSDLITYSTANGCTLYTVTINRRTESVIARREPDPDGYAALCYAPIDRDAVLRTSLQDGWRVQQQLQREAEARVIPWMWAALGVWVLLLSRELWRVWREKRPADATSSQPSHSS